MRWLTRVCLWAVVVGVLLAGGVARAGSYTAPDLKVKPFGGELTIEVAERQKMAAALAGLVRNLNFTQKTDYQTASRLLGLALSLDPDCKDALIVNGDLEENRFPKHKDDFSVDDALKQLRTAADGVKDSKNKPEQHLAAYLYSAASAITPSDDDTYKLQLLKRGGVKADWKWGMDPMMRHASSLGHNEPVPEVKATTKINSVVVTTAVDGNWHGRISPIIAVKSDRTGIFAKPQLVFGMTYIGREMMISLEEAIRAANAHHAGAGRAPLDLSFQEKYTEKDGGSAGTAFTLLILAACGDFELNPNAALTGDITVDEKIQSVGMVAEKIHGAALDHATLMAVPSCDAGALDDAILLHGPGVLCETQIVGIDTLNDAIAVMRSDADPKLTQALAAFDKLKPQLTKLTLENVAAASNLKKPLEEVLALAPNHLSAKYLLGLINGQKAAHLTLLTSITEAFAAMGPMRTGLTEYAQKDEYGTDDNLNAARKSLARVEGLADPAAKPLFAPLLEYCTTYAAWGNAERRKDYGEHLELSNSLGRLRGTARAALAKIITDPEVVDRLMRR